MKWLLICLALLSAVLIPLLGGNYIIRLATIMMMYMVISLSWNFIGGFTGYPSFATAAFFGAGAYVAGISQLHGLPMPLAWFVGALAAATGGAGLGFAILRLKGHYFAIASLVVCEVLREIVNTSTSITGGGMGLNLPILKMDVKSQAILFYCSMLFVVLITLGATFLVTRHRLGFGLKCIKQNEDAANLIGIDTTFYKTIAFILSSAFVGVAGGIYASWVNYIEPGDVFDVLISIKAIVMVFLGGAGTLFGPIVGAIAFLFMEELVWRNFLTFHSGALGILVVCLIIFLPNGILSLGFLHFKVSPQATNSRLPAQGKL